MLRYGICCHKLCTVLVLYTAFESEGFSYENCPICSQSTLCNSVEGCRTSMLCFGQSISCRRQKAISSFVFDARNNQFSMSLRAAATTVEIAADIPGNSPPKACMLEFGTRFGDENVNEPRERYP